MPPRHGATAPRRHGATTPRLRRCHATRWHAPSVSASDGSNALTLSTHRPPTSTRQSVCILPVANEEPFSTGLLEEGAAAATCEPIFTDYADACAAVTALNNAHEANGCWSVQNAALTLAVDSNGQSTTTLAADVTFLARDMSGALPEVDVPVATGDGAKIPVGTYFKVGSVVSVAFTVVSVAGDTLRASVEHTDNGADYPMTSGTVIRAERANACEYTPARCTPSKVLDRTVSETCRLEIKASEQSNYYFFQSPSPEALEYECHDLYETSGSWLGSILL